MKTKSTFAKLTSLALLVATLTIYAAKRAGASGITPVSTAAAAAQTEPPKAVTFSCGGLNIGRGQTASIIAILLPDANGRDQQPVEVEFMFHDWDGNLLASETKTLLPGHASSFETRGIIAISKERVDLLPCVKVLVNPSDATANRIVANLEVSDTATGKTQFALFCRKAGEKPVEY